MHIIMVFWSFYENSKLQIGLILDQVFVYFEWKACLVFMGQYIGAAWDTTCLAV